MAGIYIHIPFCRQACTYCNFHFSTSLQRRSEMMTALRKEAVLRRSELEGIPVKTIYFGGGTPSVLPVEDLKYLLDDLFTHYDCNALQELTLEANPDDLTAAYLQELCHTPVNRFSIGIQSFRDEDLRFMNRAHNASQAEAAIKRAQDAGFENLTVDLIYGTPGLTDSAWLYNLNRIAACDVPHLSAYALTVEEGTALAHFIQKGKSAPVDAAQSAAQAMLLMEWASQNGYEQYEISNFARVGHRAMHNSAYWQGVLYLGIGPSAHSYDSHKTRRWNVANNSRYLESILQQNEVPHETETLTDRDLHNEYVMTALRRIEGIELAYYDQRWGAGKELMKAAEKYLASAKIVLEAGHLRLTSEGRLFADGIAGDLFL